MDKKQEVKGQAVFDSNSNIFEKQGQVAPGLVGYANDIARNAEKLLGKSNGPINIEIFYQNATLLIQSNPETQLSTVMHIGSNK